MSGDYRDRENHRSLENRERIKIMVACNKLNWYAAYTRVNPGTFDSWVNIYPDG